MKNIVIIILLAFITAQATSQTYKPKQQDNSKPFVLGTIEELPSQVLGEKRILNIYLPEGYNPNDTIAYHATIMHQAVFNAFKMLH